MVLSSFLAEMLNERGLTPHQVSIVTDNVIAQASGPRLSRRNTGFGPEGRNSRMQLVKSLRKTISDPSLVVRIKRDPLSRCNSTAEPNFGQQMGRRSGTKHYYSPSKNSSWNTLEAPKNANSRSRVNKRVLPKLPLVRLAPDSVISLPTDEVLTRNLKSVHYYR